MYRARSDRGGGYPNFVLLTRHTVYVGIPEDAADLPEDTKLFDTMHITRVETIGEDPPSA